MKKLFFLLLIAGYGVKAQTTLLSRIVISKEDSTILVNNGDTSYVFSAYILTEGLNGISTITLTSKNYVSSNNTWPVVKDTSYTWGAITITNHNNQSYNICKENDNLLKVCLGRLNYATRQKFLFTLSGSNGVLTKEFVF
jgi:hypothetical protein